MPKVTESPPTQPTWDVMHACHYNGGTLAKNAIGEYFILTEVIVEGAGDSRLWARLSDGRRFTMLSEAVVLPAHVSLTLKQ